MLWVFNSGDFKVYPYACIWRKCKCYIISMCTYFVIALTKSFTNAHNYHVMTLIANVLFLVGSWPYIWGGGGGGTCIDIFNLRSFYVKKYGGILWKIDLLNLGDEMYLTIAFLFFCFRYAVLIWFPHIWSKHFCFRQVLLQHVTLISLELPFVYCWVMILIYYLHVYVNILIIISNVINASRVKW